ncbi:hypothetical protein GCK32_013864 [Trichostrongylus colubriformis]|uniref:Uncharacterized protein n=1 Tax=Trichostrongylus colubriformis TaxID=6319 RepID=A0AAN8F4L5_TRICO
MVKTCIICGGSVHALDVRRSSSARRQNVILMASLALGGEIERSSVNALVDNACTENKFFCHTHLVAAAQYISAEMAMVGRRFSHFEDPTAWASTAYVGQADIPPHLIKAFNEMKNSDSVVITERDVCTFLNNALRKYHGTPLWPERPEEKGQSTSAADVHSGKPNLYEALQSAIGAKSSEGNVALAISAITTGLRYAELEQLATQLNLSFLSKAAFLKMLEWTRPAAEHVYCNHLRSVVEGVQAFFKAGGGLSLSANGSYDGLGYTSLEDEVRDDNCSYPIMNISLQKDFYKTDSSRGNSRCGSNRSPLNFHCDRRTFYPVMTHPLYALMASMHSNTLRLSEVNGKRKKSKTMNASKKSRLDSNPRGEHEWRDAILLEVLQRRSQALEGRSISNCTLSNATEHNY